MVNWNHVTVAEFLPTGTFIRLVVHCDVPHCGGLTLASWLSFQFSVACSMGKAEQATESWKESLGTRIVSPTDQQTVWKALL